MLKPNESLIRAGGSIVVLRPRDKRPADNNWTELPRLTWDQAVARFRSNENIGIRLGKPSYVGNGYIQGFDLDIRDPTAADEAKRALKSFTQSTSGYALVRSGSGGHSQHLYWRCREAFRSRVIAHSDDKFIDKDGKSHWRWEIELGGTGKQFVLPPSIHPITRKPYEWIEGEPPDWEALPWIEPDVVRSWLPPLERGRPLDDPDFEDDLSQLSELARKVRFEKTEVEDILDRLSDSEFGRAEFVESRDGWLRAGMALHDWCDGGSDGYELWCGFSANSDKFDEADNWRVWKSFAKTAGSRSPLTMRTLYDRSNQAVTADRYGLIAPMHADVSLPDDFDTRLIRQARIDRERHRNKLLGIVRETDPIDTTVLSDEFEGQPRAWRWDDVQTVLEEVEDEQRKDRQFAESAWLRELERTDTDTIKATPPNIALIVANDHRLRGIIGYNEFTNEIVARKPFDHLMQSMYELPIRDAVNGDLWSDEHDGNLALFLATAPKGRDGGYGFKPAKAVLELAVLSAAKNNAFHPVRDYLRAQRWDGMTRADSVFCRYLGAPDEPYYREICRVFLVAAVARVMSPGCKFDFSVILEGLEGKRKSTFIRILAKDWFGELNADFHDRKAVVEQMQGVWIAELPELAAMNRTGATANDAKAFLSAQEDRVRLAYARRAGVYRRQCVFMGSTNEPTYLTADFGNRRYWPMPCSVETIDTEGLAREVDQVWAETVVLWRELFKKHAAAIPLYLSTAGAADEAKRLQVSRKIETSADTLTADIRAWLDTPICLADAVGDMASKFDETAKDYLRCRVCPKDVWTHFLGNDENSIIDPLRMPTILRALTGLGWENTRVYVGGRQLRFRVRPDVKGREAELGYCRIGRN